MILNRKFGPYVLLKRLAVGGMAELFLATKVGPGKFEKLVVIKTILPHSNDDPDYVRLFYREAELGALLNHPHVVHTYDCDVHDDTHYMVMEHMDGVTVAEMAERGAELGLPLPQEFAIRICIDACEGLHHVHTLRNPEGTPLGVVHRDISPQNVFVTYSGFAKIFDFGIAQITADVDDDSTEGMLAGKYAYMSPEQCRGEPLDGRSDVFSLGVILYELTTGYRLFKRDSQVRTLTAITEEEITPPTQLLDRYPKYLERIVLRALERDREARYTDALEFADDMRKFLKISGSKPTDHLLGAYLSKLFAKEIKEFTAFRSEAIAAVEEEHGRDDPLAELLARMPERPKAPEVVDADELVPDRGPTVAAPGTAPREVHVPDRPTGPQRLAQVEIAEGEEEVGGYSPEDLERLARARRTNRILLAVAALAIVAAIGAVLYFLLVGPGESTSATDEAPEQVTTGTGTLKVTTTPLGAKVLINGAEQEKTTPAEFEVPTEQPLTVELVLDGYKTVTEEVRLSEGQQRFVIDEKLREGTDEEVDTTPTAAVRLVTEPPGARVVYDGQPRTEGVTPLILPEVEVGEQHVVVLDADGHESLIYPFTIDEESEQELLMELAPADPGSLGTLILDSWPRGARVTIDEQFAGNTPLPPLKLQPGDYALKLELDPYESHAEEIEIEAGETLSLDPRLTGGGDDAAADEGEKVLENAAFVDIDSEPDTEVFIDSESVGRTPLTQIPVAPGTVWIEFRDPAQGIRHVEVASFKPNEIASVSKTIPKGTLSVDSTPSATVFLDDKEIGETPLEQKVYVGEHTVRLEAGGKKKTIQAPIHRNKTLQINETF